MLKNILDIIIVIQKKQTNKHIIKNVYFISVWKKKEKENKRTLKKIQFVGCIRSINTLTHTNMSKF